jgi:hypothetical protein
MCQLVRPRRRLQCPNAVRVLLFELLRQLAQHRVVVRGFVMAHALPIKSLGRDFRIRVTIENLAVPAFCICPVFVHEGNTRETHIQLRPEFVIRQIALETMPLNAVCIQYENCWCPRNVEAMEVDRVFFDVHFERDEVFVDEGCGLIVTVRLGFQPSTCASGRGRTEIDEQRFLAAFCFRKRSVSVC